MLYRLPEDGDEALLQDYVREHHDHGENSISASLGLSSSVYTEWVAKIQKNAAEGDETWGKSLLYLCFDGDRLAGLLSIRYELPKEISEKYGDIGYGVRPSERNKGYATEMLRHALRVCREKGMEKVILGCYQDNLASAATIRKNGGVLMEENEKYQKGRISQYYLVVLENKGGNPAMKLIEPTAEYEQQIRDYRKEFLDHGDSMDGTGSLRECEGPAEWIRRSIDGKNPETTMPGLVPATQYLFVREEDNKLVGMIQIRHYFNAYLEKYGGHIGYSVAPSERRKGYAGEMLRAALPACKALGLKRVLITCNSGNEGSRRTILKNGGIYESDIYEPDEAVTLERYWIEIS